jgi:UDP-N-acetyl-D-glucosamine dehydrogenase
MIKDEIIKLIENKSAGVGVIGLGYVGLPLATEFAGKGFKAIGFEVDESKVARIKAGESYIGDVSADTVRDSVNTGRLKATTDFAHLKSCDAIVICVPTPLRKTKEPDVSFILAAAEEIQRHLRRGQLIILESTTYPGTTDEVLLPMLEETGLKLDQDFLLAFSPERVDPGNPQFQTHNIPKVVGGVTDDSTEPQGFCIHRSSIRSILFPRRGSLKLPSSSRILFALSTSAWPTRWPGSVTR